MTAGSGNSTDRPARRILLVEDEAFLAFMLELDLKDAGYTVIGPYANVTKALEAVKSAPVDAAVLDVNLNGDFVFPLADHLMAQNVPVILLSGYGERQLPERYRSLPLLAKPHAPEMLLKEIIALIE